MPHLNVEFKASAENVLMLENKLKGLNALYTGEDHQVDTYFNVTKGRLKLREGNIENSLIYYERENIAGIKQSKILLYRHNPDKILKEILVTTHGIKVVVKKLRRIYFRENVKFHFDVVDGLGSFIEVEAIDADNTIGLKKLEEQCNYYAAFFEIEEGQYVDVSYSDMIIEKWLDITTS
ncbi:MAG: class IV adenylate cyclase [Ferruginibacter sp.]